MRWPFGPPHLTLKPSKKNKKWHKKQTKKKKQKTKKSKKTQKYQKKSFSVINQNFFFSWGGVQKLPFLTTWPRKRAPPKHYKNRAFSLFFLKKVMRHETAIFGQKNPNPEIPVIIFFCLFLFQQQKTPKLAETPIL